MIYAIGDIHGQFDMLLEIMERIKKDAAGRDHRVIFIGDLCDRGPHSRGVIEYIMQGQENGANWDVIRGNHDRYLQQFARTGALLDPQGATRLDWLNPRLGGDKTLLSFGIDPENDPILHKSDIPENIVSWLEKLPNIILTEKCAFVHAGILPHTPLEEQVEKDLIWIREPFLSSLEEHGKLIIHGHTIIENVEHFGNRIAIDTGAGKFMELSCIVIEDDAINKLGNDGRINITPPDGWTLWGKKLPA